MEEKMHWVPTSIGMVVLACIYAGIALGIYPGWAVVGEFLHQHININWGETAPAWAQAIMSFFAIAASFGGIWWQLRASSNNQQKKEREVSIKTSETCLEMCHALLSIIRDKSELMGRFDRRNEIELPEQVEAIKSSLWKQFLSIERTDDLQQVLRLLVAKDMPIELLRTMFTLQKLAAQHKEFMVHFEPRRNLAGSFLNQSDRSRVGLEYFRLKKEISRLIKRIVEFKETLENSEKI